MVCTSSLDLGVDFSPVERVFQLGSVKGVARLIQRAGRAGHRPGAPVPHHLRADARAGALRDRRGARSAVDRGSSRAAPPHEQAARRPRAAPRVVRTGRRLCGRRALRGGDDDGRVPEPDARRVRLDAGPGRARRATRCEPTTATTRSSSIDGRYLVEDRRIARQHRMSIGTITSDASVQVRFVPTTSGWARSRSRSSRGSSPATCSCSPAACSSWSI